MRQVCFCGGDKGEFDDWKQGLSAIAKAAAKKKAEQTLKVQIDDEGDRGEVKRLNSTLDESAAAD